MQNKYATGACDGWKNVRKDSLIGSTANVEGNPVLLNVNDISSRPKTAETLLEIVESEIEYILNVLQAILVAWCTDASGESAKMRRLLVRRYPWLVVLDCWAHQVQLVVGDLWRADDPLIRAMDRATEVVKWFNNHSLALGVLKKEQTTRRTKVLCLILPGATRWTSHFLCISRLLELEECLRLLPVATERHQTLMRAAGPKRDAKNKAAEILRTIVEPGFWEYLKSLWDVLRPFAIASNVTQGDNARLDTVLCTLAHLYHIFSKPSFPECVRRAVLPSLEKRWANADQPIFILAVVLNPYIRARAFHPNSAYRTPAGLRSLVSDAFQRFFGELPDYEMDSAFTDYVAWAGEWSAEGMNLANTRQAAKAQRVGVNLVQLWRAHDTDLKNGRNGLVKLAMRVLSMVPNSAATERCFSIFRAIHSDHRNRMEPEKVRRMTIVNADTQARYGAPPQPRRKRKFGDDDGEHGALATTPAVCSVPSSTSPTSSSSSLHEPDLPPLETDPDFPIDPRLATSDPSAPSENPEDTADEDDFPSLRQILQESADTADMDTSSDNAAHEDRTLKNLFHYPSVSEPSPESLGFMTEFWQRGETGLDAEKQFHEACCETLAENNG